MKLGTLLLRNEVISLTQLEAALRTQILYGGRLGTNLVELGYIDMGTLAEYLAEILGVPLASQEMFESVSEAVISDFGAALARRYEAFPLGYLADRPNVLAVAMIEPGDADAIAKLQDELGGAVQPHVAPELRIYYYLEKHYGITRKARYVRVGSVGPVPETARERRRMQPARGIVLPPKIRLEPRKRAGSEGGEPGTSAAVASAAVAPEPGAPAQAAAESVPAAAEVAPAAAAPVAAALVEAVPAAEAPVTAVPVAAAREPSGPVSDEAVRGELSYREACAAIDKADRRDIIGHTLVGYARGRFEVAMVFLMRDGNALGWKLYNSDPARTSYPIEELSLPLGGISVLQTAHDSGKIFRGKSPSVGKPIERQLWDALGTEREPEEMVVVPITVKQRVVNLIYVHAIGGGAIDDTALKKLGELAQRAGRAYARLIQAAKTSVRSP